MENNSNINDQGVPRISCPPHIDEDNVLFLSLSEMRAAGLGSPPDYTIDIPPPKADFSAPPPYDASAKLPTYEEVQREKTLEGEPIPDIPTYNTRTNAPLAVLAVEPEANEDPNAALLGTDLIFFTSFFIAFVFNWIGLLLLMCFCHTVASRYGSLAGFGLSLTKWVFIVKNTTDFASQDSWLWWLLMVLGIMIFIRATVQYFNIKRGWRLLSSGHQERLLFFY